MQLIMQVRSGGATGISRQGYPFTTLYGLSASDQDPAQMQVAGDVMTAMLDFNVFSGKRMTMNTGYHTVSGRKNRGTRRHCKINAVMRHDATRDRMAPSSAEMRCDLAMSVSGVTP